MSKGTLPKLPEYCGTIVECDPSSAMTFLSFSSLEGRDVRNLSVWLKRLFAKGPCNKHDIDKANIAIMCRMCQSDSSPCLRRTLRRTHSFLLRWSPPSSMVTVNARTSTTKGQQLQERSPLRVSCSCDSSITGLTHSDS